MKRKAILVVDQPENPESINLIKHFIIPNIDSIVNNYDLSVIKLDPADMPKHNISQLPCLNFENQFYYQRNIKTILMGLGQDNHDLDPVQRELYNLEYLPAEERGKRVQEENHSEVIQNERQERMNRIKEHRSASMKGLDPYGYGHDPAQQPPEQPVISPSATNSYISNEIMTTEDFMQKEIQDAIAGFS